MSWSSEKKILYISVVGLITLVIVGVPVYFKYFNHTPSCFDNKMNQDEGGVDCGGVCARLCPNESRDPILSLERLYYANPGTYGALALLENVNQGVFARKMSYSFRVYDKNNILLFEIPGTTFVPPGRVFPIFISPILTGNREASKAVFQITDEIDWEKGYFNEPDLDVVNVSKTEDEGQTAVQADVFNNEVYPIKDTQVVAIIYDNNGNAVRASSTRVPYISPKDKANVVFTWTEVFGFEVGKIDIIPRPYPRDL